MSVGIRKRQKESIRKSGKAIPAILLALLLFLLPAEGIFHKEKSCELFILLYHDLTEDEKAAESNRLYATTPEKFEADLVSVSEMGYQPLSLLDFYEGNYEAGGRYFSVTFDDGYLSNYLLAFPILEKLGIPGDIFTVVGTVGRSNHFKYFHADEMEKTGLVRIYSHTLSHLDMTSLEETELREDISESFSLLEERLSLSRPRLISYPGGSYNDETISVLRECGAEIQFVQDTPPLSPPDLVKRYMVYFDTDMASLLTEFRSSLHPGLHAVKRPARETKSEWIPIEA